MAISAMSNSKNKYYELFQLAVIHEIPVNGKNRVGYNRNGS